MNRNANIKPLPSKGGDMVMIRANNVEEESQLPPLMTERISTHHREPSKRHHQSMISLKKQSRFDKSCNSNRELTHISSQ